jgi:hypothetical protein
MTSLPWLSEALKYIGSGALGAAVSWGLSWIREHRRTLDAYRAPQRDAIGEIIVATHAFMMRELEMRTSMAEMVEQIRQISQQENFDAPGEQLKAAMLAMGEQLMAAMAAMGSAMLGVDRAFHIGTLTIIDAPCWEAMGAAYFEFHKIRSVMKAGAATEMQTVEEVDQYIEAIAGHATQFNKGVSALVRAANDRVSPADTRWNRWRRRRARHRLGKRYQQPDAVQTPEAPQPHY